MKILDMHDTELKIGDYIFYRDPMKFYDDCDDYDSGDISRIVEIRTPLTGYRYDMRERKWRERITTNLVLSNGDIVDGGRDGLGKMTADCTYITDEEAIQLLLEK